MIMVTIMIIFVSMVITTIIIIVYNYDDHYGDHYDYHHHPNCDELSFWSLSEFIVDGLSWSSIHDWSREREEIWTTGKIEAHDTWLWLIDW